MYISPPLPQINSTLVLPFNELSNKKPKTFWEDQHQDFDGKSDKFHDQNLCILKWSLFVFQVELHLSHSNCDKCLIHDCNSQVLQFQKMMSVRVQWKTIYCFLSHLYTDRWLNSLTAVWFKSVTHWITIGDLIFCKIKYSMYS